MTEGTAISNLKQIIKDEPLEMVKYSDKHRELCGKRGQGNILKSVSASCAGFISLFPDIVEVRRNFQICLFL